MNQGQPYQAPRSQPFRAYQTRNMTPHRPPSTSVYKAYSNKGHLKTPGHSNRNF